MHIIKIRGKKLFLKKRWMYKLKILIKWYAINKAKDEKLNEMNAVSAQIQSNLDTQLKTKLLTLYSQKTCIGEEMQYIYIIN